MFKIKISAKPEHVLPHLDRDVYIVDQVTGYTAFVYDKINKNKVSVYHRINTDWYFNHTISWESYQCSKRLLTS